MDLNRIMFLLDRYYSGDILPEEYEILLSALEAKEPFTPELEKERRMLLAIESCAPIVPECFEKRLEEAIEQRQRRSGKFMKRYVYGSVAAIVLVLMVIGGRYSINNSLHPEHRLEIAAVEGVESVGVVKKEPTSSGFSGDDIEKTARLVSTSDKVAKSDNANVPKNLNDEEFEEALQTVDNALLSMISDIRMSQNSVAECMEEIEITQKTDFNSF